MVHLPTEEGRLVSKMAIVLHRTVSSGQACRHSLYHNTKISEGETVYSPQDKVKPYNGDAPADWPLETGFENDQPNATQSQPKRKRSRHQVPSNDEPLNRPPRHRKAKRMSNFVYAASNTEMIYR